MRKIIRNALLTDGTGRPTYRGDLLMEGDRIQAVGGDIDCVADWTTDAEGMAVTPGFIDIHRHPDYAAFDSQFGMGEQAQGIATIVGGNCGLSPVPMRAQNEAACRDFLAPCLGTSAEPLFSDLTNYFGRLGKRPLPVNMGMLAAAGAVLRYVKGFGNAPLTPSQMEEAQALLRDELAAGALGVSLGVMYAPECFATKQEYIRLLSAATPFARPMCCHIRGEGATLVDSVAEVLDIARETELPLHISHFKSTGKKNWRHLIFEAIQRIEDARARGQDVTVDFYPYEAGASTLLSLVPNELIGNDQDAFLREVGTSAGKAQMRAALYKHRDDWDNMVLDIGWERITLSAAEGFEEYAGLDFATLAQRMRLSDPSDAMCEILSATHGRAGVVLMSMCADDVQTVARLPYSLLISDALYGAGAAHPRQKGAFPRFLKQYVPQSLSFEEAIRKMTSMPAARLGIRERGRLEAGCYADIAMFDARTLRDEATYEQPQRLSQGMKMLMVNGETVWESEAQKCAGAGRILLATSMPV